MRNAMNWINPILKFGGYFLFLIVSVATLLEIIFRILPTSDSLRVQPVSSENDILRFEKNRRITKQIGFNFTHVNIKNINNYGFASDRDFYPKEGQDNPIISVIGDSYVEALQVTNRATFHGIIDEKLQNFDVYALGVSGSPLSQYLAYAKYVKAEMVPDFYIFLIIENDFDESFYEIKKEPGYHYFDKNGALERIDYNPSIIKKIARLSAFVRYLILDLKINSQLSRILNLERISAVSIDNMVSDKKGMAAIDLFIKGISEFTQSSNVILLLDGDRYSIYNGMVERDLTQVRNIWYKELINRSKEVPNLQIVNLQPYFQNDWALNNESFNYDYDFHWNEHGHAVAASALLQEIEKFK